MRKGMHKEPQPCSLRPASVVEFDELCKESPVMRHIAQSDRAAGEAAKSRSTTKTYLCVTTSGVGLRTESFEPGIYLTKRAQPVSVLDSGDWSSGAAVDR
ncbi:unnamed protein product [Fusarium venenatum]|uniref:Uncharacterized protein n=1 Tax=Fusarium venenatum TaxID=56646 RepID=A0A2L2TT27_9HYPO|nr:uncharacterized protein FVRRES_00882 [Fusarium venenatum]CEI64370.1 unnamed protein product [Fusarium venenatum]